MRCRDRGLELVGARLPERHRALEDARTLVDPPAIPQRAVLILEQDDLSVTVDASSATRVLEQHQCEQAEHLRLVRHQHRQELREPDRLLAQVVAHEGGSRARRVALVEHEVEDGEDRAQTLGEEVVGRNPERNARSADLALCAHQPLCHRRLGDEERARDLPRGQTSDLAQCQRDAALRCQRRVAAREHEREPLVGNRAHVVLLRRKLLEPADELCLALEDLLAADAVDGAVARGRDDPGAGRLREPFAGPTLESSRECVLHGVLGKLEIAEDAREDADGAPPFLAEDTLDLQLHAAVIAESDGSRSPRPRPPPE